MVLRRTQLRGASQLAGETGVYDCHWIVISTKLRIQKYSDLMTIFTRLLCSLKERVKFAAVECLLLTASAIMIMITLLFCQFIPLVYFLTDTLIMVPVADFYHVSM